MIYQIKRYSLNDLSIAEQLDVPDNTKFYSCNQFIEKDKIYSTFVAILPYSRNLYYKLLPLNNSFIYVLFPLNKMIFVLKDSMFIEEQPQFLKFTPRISDLYLECGRRVNGVDETKEIYKLIDFVGLSFDVIKVTFRNPLSDQEIPSISRELIDLPVLFHDQRELTVVDLDSIYTKFTTEKVFKDFYTFVENLIHYGEEM